MGMITIAITNQKGGVGKTTIAFNMCRLLASRKNTSVLAIDNDPQGNLTSSFMENTADLNARVLDIYDEKTTPPMKVGKNLYLFGSDITLAPVAERDFQIIFKLKESIEKFKDTFDYAIIDCLPSLGNLQLAALNASRHVLIPVKPAPYAILGLKDLLLTIERVRKYFNPTLKILGILINQADGRRPIMEREMETVLRKTYRDMVFKTKIRKRVRVEESPAFQQSVSTYDPGGPSAKEFDQLIREIQKRLKRLVL